MEEAHMFLLLCCCAAVSAIAVPASSYVPLAKEDYETLRNLPQGRAGILPGFSYIFVESGGKITRTRNDSAIQVEIAGSPKVQDHALDVAAGLLVKMTEFMDPNIFSNMAHNMSIGIFSAREKLIIYPEYKYLASGDCGSSCSGKCSSTCTFDGRKYEDLAGVGGKRALALDDNVLCTVNDPYRRTESVLIHEMTHTIHNYALGATLRSQILKTYKNAVAKNIWSKSYATANENEYFAIGTAVYFGVNRNVRRNSGGMNYCGNYFCKTETDNRKNLESHDPELVNIIAHVFTKDDHDLLLNITTCPSPSDLAGK